MIIPESATSIIKMQRSGYKGNTIKSYIEDITIEFYSMIDYIYPIDCQKILDIGCGISGIDILLYDFFDNPELNLFDKNIIDKKIFYGYNKKSAFYNSFDILKNIMDMNNIKNYIFHDQSKGFPEIKNVDIVLSLLACGFHFPVSDYIDSINKCLSIDGILIIDIRKGYENQIEEIKKYFNKIEEIKTDNKKTVRICAKEKIINVGD